MLKRGDYLRLKWSRRHVTAARRLERPAITAIVLAMDFVSNALFDGKRFRTLTVVDLFTRECLAIEVDKGLRGDDGVVAVMETTAPAKARVHFPGLGPLGLLTLPG